MNGGFDGKAFAAALDPVPGVYQMIDGEGNTLYIGKAKRLRNRVKSYFTKKSAGPRLSAMRSQIAAIEIHLTRTENEALILENRLIKSCHPKYNIMLRDDKSYPYLFLSSAERFPRLAFHRGARKQKGSYFGPFPGVRAVRETMNTLQKLFHVRQCEDTVFAHRSRPCLQYQIKRCQAPCVDHISVQQYARDVRYTRQFLEGRSSTVLDELVEQMDQASSALEYEQAAIYRDRIAKLKRVQQKQFVDGVAGDLDLLGVWRDGDRLAVHLVSVRGGRNMGGRTLFPKAPLGQQEGEILAAFISQYYQRHQVPRELIVSAPIPDQGFLATALSTGSGKRVSIVARPRGARARTLEFTIKNARYALELRQVSAAGYGERNLALSELLDFPETLQRVECFDVSHISGEATVASCVVFGVEGPIKAEYRRFNIRGVEAGDDYGAMRQAVQRRYQRVVGGEGQLPDLLLIDGGIGQLNQVAAVMDELGVVGVMLVGVAKGAQRSAGAEVLVVRGRSDPLYPGHHSTASRLIQEIRDEAHRFAIAAHRAKRGKARRQSVLQQIPGIGPRRRAAILKQFGGLQGVAGAGVEELTSVPGFSRELAQRVYNALHE